MLASSAHIFEYLLQCRRHLCPQVEFIYVLMWDTVSFMPYCPLVR